MKPVAAFFQLIRWRNLVIVLLTQWFIWQCVIRPMAAWSTVPVFLTTAHFLLLSLSTVLIAAAGYIINDYFDVRIDLINRPQKVIIEKVISRRAAILWHSLFNVVGFLLALYLARQLGNYFVVIIQLACTILLWFYSTAFKRQFVTGNVVVALLTGLTVMILAVYEPALYPHVNFRYFLEEQGRVLVNPFGVIAVYTYFAFMLTWMREIVKDMEDFKGDAEDGCVTMPIRIGLQRSVFFVIGFGILAIAPLSMAAVKLFSGSWSILGVYILVALVLPLIAWLLYLPRKATAKHYGDASRWLKMIMLAGIASLLLYFWLQYYL
ncbi:geranylgeranylglycerol-phosphate geranylgeranyltransferase [Taibaiella koreensis]|uniref:geranylgeranylglycerol-phosphate geranylgeranyltransferase n=1 Tax=Taibaiella koreensis TaxID=1268548 RepID=UPI000E59F12C|nr:geranylgeranylglycerol-phosphate geranylgeranyltransferase [Taibaiella koreensis]